jgi:tetratricopeptide (TPR) repeat protein
MIKKEGTEKNCPPEVWYMRSCNMRHIFAIMIAALCLFYPLHGFTQLKEIVSEGTYNMGDGETPSVAESRALLNAKRIALEEAGTYVESYAKVENFQLTKDEIQVLTSGLMEVEILDKKRTIVGDGFRFWVKIKARVNPDNIKEIATKVKEKSVVEDYKKIQEAYDKSQREIEELKRQLAQTKDKKEREKVEAKISYDERLFQANEWFAKGYKHSINEEYDAAIKAFTSAIALNPNYEEAYYGRGIAFYGKRQFDKAIKDYSKSIDLNHNADIFDRIYKANAYFNRGNAYFAKGQDDNAIADYSRAIALNPSYFQAYFNRGVVYKSKGQNNKALEDYNRAIAINPQKAKMLSGIPEGFILDGQIQLQ